MTLDEGFHYPPGSGEGTQDSFDKPSRSRSVPILGRPQTRVGLFDRDDGSIVDSYSCPCPAVLDGVPGRVPSYRLLSPLHTGVGKAPAWGICFHLSTRGVGIAPTRKPSCPDHRDRPGVLSAYPSVQPKVTPISGKRVARRNQPTAATAFPWPSVAVRPAGRLRRCRSRSPCTRRDVPAGRCHVAGCIFLQNSQVTSLSPQRSGLAASSSMMRRRSSGSMASSSSSQSSGQEKQDMSSPW